MKSAAVVLLALWMPATMHCALETLPGFSFLQWCCGSDGATQHDHDCSQDSCSEVESGLYKIEDHSIVTPSLVILAALATWEWVAEPPAEPAEGVVAVSSHPPELPRLWQFTYRTALPPRAPSFAS